MDDDVIEAVNLYLAEKGCEYRIENVVFPEIDSTYAYAEAVETYVDNGGTIDICYLSTLFDNASLNSFDILKKDGYLEDLTDRIEGCEALNSCIPQAKIDAHRSSGRIFGLNAYPYSASTKPCYIVSRELMNRYGLTEEDLNKPISELVDLLSNVQSSESAVNDEFTCTLISADFGSECTFGPLRSIGNGIACIKMSEEESSPFVYVLDDDGFLSVLKETFELCRNTDIKTAVNQGQSYYENSFIRIALNGFFPTFDPASVLQYKSTDDSRVLTSDDFSIIYPYGDEVYITEHMSQNSVMASSKHKDWAWDFLVRSVTDKELADILQYGVNLEYVDGKVADKGVLGSWFRGNGFISTPAVVEPQEKTKILFDIYDKKGVVSSFGDFVFDKRGFEGVVASTDQAMGLLNNLLSPETEITDFDDYIATVRRKLIESGADELLNAAIEQYRDYCE